MKQIAQKSVCFREEYQKAKEASDKHKGISQSVLKSYHDHILQKKYLEEAINKITDVSGYEAKIVRIEEQIQISLAQIAKEKKIQELYIYFKDEALNDTCQCPLCKRAFSSLMERDQFIEKQIHSILESNILNDLEKIHSDLSKEYQALKSVESQYSDYRNLAINEIPKEEKNIEDLNIENKKILADLEQLETLKIQMEENELNVITTNSIIAELRILSKRMIDLESDIAKLDSQYRHNNDDLLLIRDGIRNVEEQMDRITSAKTKLDEVLLIEKEIEEYQYSLAQKDGLLDKISSLKENINRLGIQIHEKYSAISNQQCILKEKQAEHASELAKYNKTKTLIQNEIELISDIHAKLKESHNFIESHSEICISNNNNEEIIMKKKIEIKNLEDANNELNSRNESIQAELRQKEIEKSTISHKKQFVELNKQRSLFLEELAKNETKRIDIKRPNIGFDFQDITEIDSMINQCKEKKTHYSTLFNVNNSEIHNSTKKIETEYSNINDVLRDYNIELECYVQAQKDLRLYRGFLDTKIQEEHEEKMQRINAKIRSMWEHIYTSNDINYIEIRATHCTNDQEKAASPKKNMKYFQ